MEEKIIIICSTYNMDIPTVWTIEHAYSIYEDTEKHRNNKLEKRNKLYSTCCFDHACFTMILLCVRNEVM